MTSKNNTPGKRLFIGGVPYQFREGQLLSLFVTCGKVIDVRIIKNRWGRSKGMAYVEFENEEDAIAAKEKFHNYHIQDDRTIIVDFARPDPFLTPAGLARHQLAQQKRKKNLPQTDESPQLGRPPYFSQPQSSAEHIRQTVYESRHYGSRVGAKFARRSQNRKSPRS